MEQNDKDLVKSLISIIDETIGEVEEIRKSKFAASEIKIGDDEGLAGRGKNGSLEAKKKDDEDEDEDEDDVEKGENEKADQDAGKFAQAPSVAKGENEKADQDAGKFAQAPSVSKGEDEDDDEDEDDKKKDKKEAFKEMKKSIDATESMMKSYIDEKYSSLEDKLFKMAAMIESIADAPVERRGVPAGVTALQKSVEEVEPMSKSEVANALFELKKSGEEVDSTDIFRAETGNINQANEIATKYGLK